MLNGLNELNEKVIKWADEKGILSKATPASQYQKTLEEVGELGRALIEEATLCTIWSMEQLEGGVNPKFDHLYEDVKKARHEMKDAIGDIIVTLIIQCELNDFTLEECLKQAYDVISKRNGRMVNGMFVKDE